MVEHFEYCRKIMEKHAKTFYLASQKLPMERRIHFWSIYAYCRTVDDISDEDVSKPVSEKIKELEKIKENIILSYNKNYKGKDPIFLALNETFSKFNFNIKPFFELIEGAIWDLEGKPIETFEDMINYSRLVAGSVGAMLLPVISERPDELYDKAYNYGVFMQLVNVVRDVGEDIRERNRVYIPLNLLEQFDVKIEDLRNGVITKNYINLLECIMENAEELFFKNVDSIKDLIKEVRVSILLAGRWYLEILNAVRFSKYDNLTKRNYVSKLMKLVSSVGGYKIRKNIIKILIAFT